jgi:hypothetical protein
MVVEETDPTGLPLVVQLDQTGVLVGVADQPSPRRVHRYARGADTDGLPTYHHVIS